MKAILVIDMPETCEECQFRNNNQCFALEPRRTLIEKWDGTEEFKLKNKICPLKEMPKKKYKAVEEFSRAVYCYQGIKEAGWNECIDEILGVSEDETN